MRKKKASGIRRRRRPVAISLVCLDAFGLVGFIFLSDGPTASYASASCGAQTLSGQGSGHGSGQGLAGRWVNIAPTNGPDVMSATIETPCAPVAGTGGATAPRVDIGLTVRCLHILACDWQAVPVMQAAGAAGTPRLTAHFDQANFDRTVTLEPVDANHLHLRMTSHFKGVGLGSVDAVYTLQRAKG